MSWKWSVCIKWDSACFIIIPHQRHYQNHSQTSQSPNNASKENNRITPICMARVNFKQFCGLCSDDKLVCQATNYRHLSNRYRPAALTFHTVPRTYAFTSMNSISLQPLIKHWIIISLAWAIFTFRGNLIPIFWGSVDEGSWNQGTGN